MISSVNDGVTDVPTLLCSMLRTVTPAEALIVRMQFAIVWGGKFMVFLWNHCKLLSESKSFSRCGCPRQTAVWWEAGMSVSLMITVERTPHSEMLLPPENVASSEVKSFSR